PPPRPSSSSPPGSAEPTTASPGSDRPAPSRAILGPLPDARAGAASSFQPGKGPATDDLTRRRTAMATSSAPSSPRTERHLLIVFADLTRFMVNSRGTPDAALAELLDGFYRHSEGAVEAAGGRVVKFMGDAFLAVWPEEAAGAGAAALPAIKRGIDAWMAGQGWDSRLVMKAHFGRAIAGGFGARGDFDVIGSEVNVAATLPARTVSLSAEAFRRLAGDARRGFQKHTPPIVYIPVDDPRP